MPTPQKEAVVGEVADRLKQAKSVFLTDFTGLNVADISQLRRDFRGSKVEYRVVKNTLARLSARQAGMEEILPFLEGPTAFAFGMEDPVAPAKIIKAFVRGRETPKVKACLLEGQLFEGAAVDELANLPSRHELLAGLAAGLNSPITKLALTLQATLQNLVYALNALKRKKEETEPRS
jgi:large subunit ribosomal protein L10